VINQRDAVKQPWFLIDPNNVVAEVGQQVFFEAQATGQPMPTVKWSVLHVFRSHAYVLGLTTDRGQVLQSVVSVRPSTPSICVCLFVSTLCLLNRMTFDLDFLHLYGS